MKTQTIIPVFSSKKNPMRVKPVNKHIKEPRKNIKFKKRDYLNLAMDDYLRRHCQSYGYDITLENIFSDYITRINSNMCRKIRVLLIGGHYMMILLPREGHIYKEKIVINLRDIEKITIPSEGNKTLMKLTVRNGYVLALLTVT